MKKVAELSRSVLISVSGTVLGNAFGCSVSFSVLHYNNLYCMFTDDCIAHISISIFASVL